MKGIKRLEVDNNLTEHILNYNYSENTPGISLRFLETRKRTEELGDWDNYYVFMATLRNFNVYFILMPSFIANIITIFELYFVSILHVIYKYKQ